MDAAAWDERYAAAGTLWGDEPNAFLRERLEGSPAGRAVELASGDGRHARWLADRGWTVTAVDFSAAAVAAARERPAAGGAEVDWVHADVTTWQPRTTGADLVLIAYLHLAMPALAAVLARAAGWLAPGGRLLYLGHARPNVELGAGGPGDPAILPDVADLAAAVPGLYIAELRHLLRPVEAGTAIDVILDARPWPAALPAEQMDAATSNHMG